jgi:CBS domain-containing protein
VVLLNLTFTDLNAFLYPRIKQIFPNHYNKTVAEIFDIDGKKNIIAVSDKLMAIQAFQFISSNKVSAVAVVDKDEKLIANFSASDLVGIIGESITDFALPVVEFLQKNNVPVRPVYVSYILTFIRVWRQ